MTFFEAAGVFWIFSVPCLLFFGLQIICMSLDVRREHPTMGFWTILRSDIFSVRTSSVNIEFTMGDAATIFWPRHDLELTRKFLFGAVGFLFFSLVFLFLELLCS
ncbi:hypothetical protein KBB27_00545 [Patescibacteria group bacterium]|nr:hypothetical protein [Patescibacteria group bacterium]